MCSGIGQIDNLMLVEVSICIWLAINDSTFKKTKTLIINEYYINIYNQLGVLSTFYNICLHIQVSILKKKVAWYSKVLGYNFSRATA